MVTSTTTMISTDRRWSVSSNRSETVKFPEFEPSQDRLFIQEEEYKNAVKDGRSFSPQVIPRANGSVHSARWQSRKDNHTIWGNAHANGSAPRHGRQKSLSDAIRNIRTRQGSVSANAQEIAEALKAPVSYRLVALCLIWYLSSALTNTSSKSILNAFPKPITLTLVQFAFVSTWCVFFAYLAHLYPPLRIAIPALKHGIRYPSWDVIRTTLPLALFQLGGHILSSTATSKIPVSLVHTIKGLSPLFTVLAYRFLFHIHYSTATYLSLIPLTLGVVLACSVEFGGNLFGTLCAFCAALIFVTQNIFSKKLFNEAARVEADGVNNNPTLSRKLDKLNLLCYCSGLAFLLTAPIWLWTEGFPILSDLFADGAIDLVDKPSALDHGRLTLEFIFNGAFHFGQNIIAFILLSMVSPVTYSVASLIKRVFVIFVAIVWFGSKTTPVQAAGIVLTFIGLYLYDRTSDAAKADRRAKLDQMRTDGTLLPLAHKTYPYSPPMTNNQHQFTTSPTIVENPSESSDFTALNGFVPGFVPNFGDKKNDASGAGNLGNGKSREEAWMPPGTKQEDTWRSPNDVAGAVT